MVPLASGTVFLLNPLTAGYGARRGTTVALSSKPSCAPPHCQPATQLPVDHRFAPPSFVGVCRRSLLSSAVISSRPA